MKSQSGEFEIILDHEFGIRFPADQPPLLHAHAVETHRHGLKHLAEQVRVQEQHYIDKTEFSGGGETYPDFAYFEPLTVCQFDWFAISLTNYLRLVALVDLVTRNKWSILDLVNESEAVHSHCNGYVSEVVPAVYQWRHKVAAHPAATAPIGQKNKRKGPDALGTLLQSYSYPMSRHAGYFEVGRGRWKIEGETADVLPWSVTATFERLTPRFWPENSLPPHRHKPGAEPSEDPGTYLHSVRNTK